MKKVLIVAVMTIAMMLGLTACGSNNAPEISPSPVGETPAKSEEPAASEETKDDENSTRIVKDVKGEVEIPANPQRIVDLSGASDTLSILGYQVIGTANSDGYDYTKFPSYLEKVLAGAKILGYSMQDTMDVEAIFELEPDLIILSTYQEKLYDQLKDVAPTVMIELAQLDWKADFMKVAEIMGEEEKATQWLADYEEKGKTVGESIKELYGADTSYLSFLASGGQFYVFDGAGFGDVLYTDLGLKKPEGMPTQENISLPVVNYEGLAAIGADIIFAIGTDEDMKALKENSVWKGLDAVKLDYVIELSASPYFNQGYSPIGRALLLDEIGAYLNGLQTQKQ